VRVCERDVPIPSESVSTTAEPRTFFELHAKAQTACRI